MKSPFLFFFLFLGFSSFSGAQQLVYPIIQGYGAVNDIPFEVEKPDPTKQYRLVVEIGERIQNKDQVGDLLDYAARMYNLHHYSGIPKENIHLAIVVYSGATPLILSNETYQERFEQANPNAQLLEEFEKAGVEVIVCGQSMMKQDLLPANIFPGVRMATSRFTATTDLLQKGYQIIVL
ncbi:DsrE family protein [Algoriphagus marinus]|uniref:DsrE family protein n=1 Tax=Algoriphagus marinus TaxID=1925762 RepID=UPI00094B929C|nr:DsrE family protein [Algoriphagus marinus]